MTDKTISGNSGDVIFTEGTATLHLAPPEPLICETHGTLGSPTWGFPEGGLECMGFFICELCWNECGKDNVTAWMASMGIPPLKRMEE